MTANNLIGIKKPFFGCSVFGYSVKEEPN